MEAGAAFSTWSVLRCYKQEKSRMSWLVGWIFGRSVGPSVGESLALL
jgi:hypothetical protein